MKYLAILCFLFILLGCKTHKNKINYSGIPFEDTMFSGIPFEDTMFKDSESELRAISSILNSLEQDKTILVIFNGKKITYEKFKKNIKNIDSTYTINIIKDRNEIKKYDIAKNYKALIFIDKKSQ